MIKNYFKLAIKVLGRRKFFTFISLFGISFTLMILMVITAFLDHELGNHKPMSDRDKMVFLDQLVMTLEVVDTVPKVDSSLIDGVMRYDTTYDYVDRRPNYSSSSLSYTFLKNHLKEVDGAEKESFYQPGSTFDIFINSNKLSLSAIYTDATYWSIFDFTLKEGRFYQPQEVENQEQVVVIPEETALSYFG
ncbi:MAG: ABC transporter permease, partial [Bacteroidota bacterium]